MFNVLICTLCGVYMQGMIIIMPPLPMPAPPPEPEKAKIELIIDPKKDFFV